MADAVALSVGSVVGGYRIEQVLGSGGMGTVYLAANPVLPRHDALKVLNPELSQDESFRARFIREAALAARLDHPNIVAVHNRGETEEGQLWIAMQYIAGTDADKEAKQGRMSPQRAAYIVGEVAKALDHAHRHGLIHRDVKPANFLLAPGDGAERVFLADFGIARGDDDTGELTKSGVVLSTVAYGAPETLSGAPVDGRADIYSLGCSLYRLLAGQAPFAAAGNMAAAAAAHLLQPPPRVTDLARGLPRGIDVVLARAMAKDPAQRYQSAREFAAAATDALQGRTDALPGARGHADPTRPVQQGVPAVLGPRPPGWPARPRHRWWQRKRWVALLAAVTVTIAAVDVGVLVRGHHANVTPSTVAVADTADVTLMDTGGYPTKPWTPKPAAAGGEGFIAITEAVRMSAYVVGPWQIDKELIGQQDVVTTELVSPNIMIGDRSDSNFASALDDIAAAHGFVAGFVTGRRAPDGIAAGSRAKVLVDSVMRFPTADAAAHVVTDAVARVRAHPSSFTSIPVDDDTPGAFMQVLDYDESGVFVTAIAPHGAYVLQVMAEVARATSDDPYRYAQMLVGNFMKTQKPLIDGFTPTDRAKLAELPVDPTNSGLLAHTLLAPDQDVMLIGVYETHGWLHFEDDPFVAGKLLEDAGVEWVSHFLGTVYQARDPDSARALTEKYAAGIADAADIDSVSAPPGLPAAHCFERTADVAAPADPDSRRWANWHFKCVANVDRYMITTVSNTEKDVKQQISAQYRILAGV